MYVMPPPLWLAPSYSPLWLMLCWCRETWVAPGTQSSSSPGSWPLPLAFMHTRDPLSHPNQVARGGWQGLACNKEGAIDVNNNPQNPNIKFPGRYIIILILKAKGFVDFRQLLHLTAFNINRNYRQKSSLETTDIVDLTILLALYSRLSLSILEIY